MGKQMPFYAVTIGNRQIKKFTSNMGITEQSVFLLQYTSRFLGVVLKLRMEYKDGWKRRCVVTDLNFYTP